MEGQFIGSIVDVIRKKRNGEILSDEEIQFFVNSLNPPNESHPHAHQSQIGAFLMAAYLQGLSLTETCALTTSMARSGYTFEWPKEWRGSIVDKHSTGGVGDKVSLVLAPALAAAGLYVPMVSGRGLDFTGGTLDKLESIPGFRVSLTSEEMKIALKKVGCCIVGQTSDLVPADKLLYAVRDTTATVDNEDLVVASILSKKAAEGLDSLVLDVKVGTGSINKTMEQATALATKLVSVGNGFGMKTAAVISRMDTPLGNTIGNALEVAEAIETLQGNGPADLVELTSLLGGQLLVSIGKTANIESGKEEMKKLIDSGKALAKFHDMLTVQGVTAQVAKDVCYGDMWSVLQKAPLIATYPSANEGFITKLDALGIARICHSLGCGRTHPSQPIHSHPGIRLLKKCGDFVKTGDAIMEVHHTSKDEWVRIQPKLQEVLEIHEKYTEPSPLFVKLIQ